MTPLAAKAANELTAPIAKRHMVDDAKVVALLGQDVHCFDVTAISKPVHDALDAENLWPDVESMLPQAFLPSPITWLEYNTAKGRIAWVLEKAGEAFRLSMVMDDPLYSLPLCEFRARSVFEMGERIAISSLMEGIVSRDKDKFNKSAALATVGEAAESRLPLTKRRDLAQTKLEILEAELKPTRARLDGLDNALHLFDDFDEFERLMKLGIAFSTLALDLINTPGLIGLRSHDAHRGLARKLAAYRSGSYPLRSWSEVVLKHQTKFAEPGERQTGATFHKCLHFVRSHLRHYQTGKVTVIPAHWRGDAALGIKRTRYRVAA